MNANEVLANRCSQLAGQPIGSKRPVHPNDHVNMGQSSNDVIPTAIHVAAAETLQNELMPALQELYEALGRQVPRVLGRDQDRSHAPDGRDAGASGPGVRGYARQIKSGKAAHPRRVACGGGIAPGRHGGRHGVELPPGFPAHRHFAPEQTHPGAVPRGGGSFRGAVRQGRRRGSQRPDQGHRGEPVQNRQRPPLAEQRPDAAASARSRCRRRSRAARSCRARSIR